MLFSACPKPEESYIGYLLRLTELNCYTSPSWIFQMTGLGSRPSSTAFVFNNTQNLKPLAHLTGVHEGKLAELAYHPAGPARKKLGDYLLFGSAITQYLIRPDRPKICPYCIRESGYIRRMWEIVPVTTCPIHRCVLLDECPSCRTRISWNREGISQCRCKFDWRDHSALTVEGHELLVSEQIYRLCNLIVPDRKVIPPHSSLNPLYKLDLKHFLSALIFVASQYGGFIDTKGKHLVSLKRNVEIHELLHKAFSAFGNWPRNFFSFLDWRRRQLPNKKFANGLRREFSEYKSVLYRQLSSTHLDFLRDAFEDYLATRWKGGYLSRMKRLSDSARKNTKYLSMKEAKELLRTSYVYELIESGKLRAIVEQQGKRKLVLVERASVEELKRELKGLNMRQLCNLLMLSRVRIKELMKAGQISPLRGPTVDGLAIWKFSNTEARKWLKVFKDKTVPCIKTQASRKLTLEKVMARFDRYGVSISKLLQAVVDEELRPAGINNKRGLLRFTFLDKQVMAFLVKVSHLRGEEAYSVAEAAQLLRTRKVLVWFIIRKGFIRAERLSSTTSAGLMVKRSELERFKSYS